MGMAGCHRIFSGRITIFVFDILAYSWRVHPDLKWEYYSRLQPAGYVLAVCWTGT